MARRNETRTRNEDHDEFYEVMPYAQGIPYSDWGVEDEEDAPDKDFAAIEDEGRDMAMRTLVFVALSTLAVSALLIWAVQSASNTFPQR